jgi:hypothetical protein
LGQDPELELEMETVLVVEVRKEQGCPELVLGSVEKDA